MKTLWFKNKTYGWGWRPATWQGWVIMAVWAFVFGLFVSWKIKHMPEDPTGAQVAWFLGPFFAWTVALLVICWKKGEKPRWRWGKDT